MESFQLAVRRCWNAGLSLRQAAARLDRDGHSDSKRKQLIAEWRKIRQVFGCASIPMKYLCCDQPLTACNVPPTKTHTQQELNHWVWTRHMPVVTYGDWLGVTGPGAQLRHSLAETKDETT